MGGSPGRRPHVHSRFCLFRTKLSSSLSGEVEWPSRAGRFLRHGLLHCRIIPCVAANTERRDAQRAPSANFFVPLLTRENICVEFARNIAFILTSLALMLVQHGRRSSLDRTSTTSELQCVLNKCEASRAHLKIDCNNNFEGLCSVRKCPHIKDFTCSQGL